MDSPPSFWFQPPLATNRRRKPPIDPVFLIILIPILALLFLFFFLPPFLSHTSHILKPGSVKSTWDSLNIFLILFAILCGFMASKNDDASSSGDVSGFVAESSSSVQSSGQCVRCPDPKVMSGGLIRRSGSDPVWRQELPWENCENQNWLSDDFDVDMYYLNLSRRIERENENLNRSTPVSGGVHQRSRRSEEDQIDLSDVKEIGVDTFVVRQNTPEFREQLVAKTPPPSPPSPPPSSAPSSNSKRHSFRSVGKNVKVEVPTNNESEDLNKARSDPRLPPLPPPPAPTELRVHRLHHKHKTLDRKINDVATAISSLYNQRKTKNKRKLRNNSGSSETSPPSLRSIRSPEIEEQRQTLAPPSPPPPPPPPSVFQNLFRKGGKHKRIHSVPAIVSPTIPPPPPPPPPPRSQSSIFNNIFKSGSKSKRFHSPSPDPPQSSSINSLFKNGRNSNRFNYNNAASSPPPPPPLPPPMTPPRYTVPVKSKQLSKRSQTQAQPQSTPSASKSEPKNRRYTSKGKPPLPTKTISYYEREDFLTSGSQSPLIPLPPPPPPFKMPAMKFEVRGDFVKIRSPHSSVCSSPNHDDVDLSSTVMDGGDSIGPGFGLNSFPSPDVNAKADSFISRLKNEWRMEKISYVKEKMG